MKLPLDPLLGSHINAPDMRTLNGVQLLNLICEQGPISRAALAKASGLSKPTVSDQVARLIRLGVVLETGSGTTGEAGGKPPTMVAFNADAGRVAGVAIGAEVTRVALADLRGNIVGQKEFATAPKQGAELVCSRIERSLTGLMATEPRPLQAVGIGVPGRVDCRAGVVLECGSVFDWHRVDLRTALEQRLECAVSVDNDVNVALVAELHAGAAMNADTAVLIRADTGIGSAVAIGRRIHHGSHWAAGEIAHLSSGLSATASAVPRGQLESMLGADQIARRVRTDAAHSPRLRALMQEGPELHALFIAASEGDAAAQELVRELSGHAANAVANQALAYDPDVVLLSGELFDHIAEPIREFASRTVPWASDIRRACFGEEGVLTGAVQMALTDAYRRMSRQLSADAAAGGR